MQKDEGRIEVIGARVHNLKNISVSIPRKKLTVITGLSGSGKSSLAFDTIFAEGQRRYMETFSSYARGFIGQMQRPDVDKITGLSPVISIDQKTTSKNPRSTVGTITEVYDFMRLLFARAGVAHSYLTGKPMIKFTDEQIIGLIQREYAGKKILLLAPLVNNRKGHYKELFETIRKKGFVHVRVDGEVQEIVAGMKLDRYKNHTIEVVVDRLKVQSDNEQGIKETDTRRLRQSIDRAMTQGNGLMMVAISDQPSEFRYFSRSLMCPETGLSYPEPAPHTFSFNSPSGWCPCCKGLGKIQRDNVQSAKDDIDEAIREDNWWELLTSEQMNELTNEEDEEKEEWIECPECHGKRLSKEALSYKLGNYTISDFSEMDLDVLLHELSTISSQLSDKQNAIAEPILKEICARLRFMQSVGLSYLSLNRSSESLSGGESQRIRLATQIGSRLVNVLYILDEPSIGLHQRDNQRLISSLKELRDMGIGIYGTGGETADVGDLVRTIIVDSTVTCRMKRSDVINNANIRPGDVIVGLSSCGQATYEKEYNGGMGSNGLTSARHDVFSKYLAEKYPESYDHSVPEELVYSGKYKLIDHLATPEDSTADNGQWSMVNGQCSVGKLVLSPTRTYAPVVRKMLDEMRPAIHGMVHCTGGAQTKVLHFVGDNCRVVKDNMFPVPPLFKIIQEQSGTDWAEMYKVFNMGHRLEVYVAPQDAERVIAISKSFNIDAQVVGRIEEGRRSLTIKSEFGEFEY